MSRDTLSLYKKYAPNGAPFAFSRNQYVMYQDKIFKFIYPVSDRNQLNWNEVPEPVASEYWKEELMDTVYTESSTPPSGIKLLGDRWKNKDTMQIYTWTKSGTKYIWRS